MVLGGDGTILRGAELTRERNIPLLGINIGHVGFMAEVIRPEISAVAKSVIDKSYGLDSRMVLAYEVIRSGKVIDTGWALNEVTVERQHTTMVELFVQIDGRPLSRWGCDGLIASTPTGSTAYSLSAGGPILHPRVFGIVLAPVAPHALSNRPIVLPGDALIGITIISGKDASVHFDMQSMAILQTGDMVVVNKSSKTITILHPQGHSDYRTLREKLHWNEYPSSF